MVEYSILSMSFLHFVIGTINSHSRIKLSTSIFERLLRFHCRDFHTYPHSIRRAPRTITPDYSLRYVISRELPPVHPADIEDPKVLHYYYAQRLRDERARHMATRTGFAEMNSTQVAEMVSDKLRQGDAFGLLYALSHPSIDPTYISSIPDTAFAEILRVLDPKPFIEPFAVIYESIHPVTQACYKGELWRMTCLFRDYVNAFRNIIRQRMKNRKDTGLEERKFLLNVARCTRDEEMASDIWQDIIESGLNPDVFCYNCFFEAICWSNTYNNVERLKLRVYGWNLRNRTPYTFPPFKRSRMNLGHRIGRHGVKLQILSNFSKMVETGIHPDTKTYCLVMTAFSREGDLSEVKSILKDVWDVDVDNIMEFDGDINKPVNIRADSPLYPTCDLLFTVAHIFGTNNTLPTALRIVDYISRRYNIPISRETWAELLERAFVLAAPFSLNGRPEKIRGSIPPESLEVLWENMVSPPYECKPSITMYGHYVKHAEWREKLNLMLKGMVGGLGIFRETFLKYFEMCLVPGCARFENAPSQAYSELEHKKNIVRTQYVRDSMLVSRWVRVLLLQKRWYSSIYRVLIWERIKLPLAVEIFWFFRPREGFIYHMTTGCVELNAREKKFFRIDQEDLESLGYYTKMVDGKEKLQSTPYF